MAAATLMAPAPRAARDRTPGIVRRPRLVAPLCDAYAPPLVLVVAPAGYGKTAMLQDWAEHDARPFAWLTLDERHDDPSRLARAIARAVDRVRRPGVHAPYVLVLDDAHVVERPAARQVLASTVDDLPPGATVALAARSQPTLPVARLRAQRTIVEIGPRELAMSRAEAVVLFRLAGVRLDGAAIDALVRRTEGWPVGLSLAALSLGKQPTATAVGRFGGRDRVVADYIRDEVLAKLEPEHLRFLRHTSILDTLTGPLCDAVLGRTRSASALGELAGAGAMLVPLDRVGDHFRHHRLLAETLQGELQRAEPDVERELHRRAGAWHRAHGDVDRALHHALAAGDVDVAGALVWDSVGPYLTNGRNAVLERWLDRFSAEQVAGDPGLCLAEAGRHLVRGQGHLAEHWVARAAAAAPTGRLPEGALAVVRAAVARGGMEQMREDAAVAAALVDDDSPWRALCALLSGVAAHLGGARDSAAAQLEDAAHRAAVRAPNVHALCLAQLAVLALEVDDWEGAVEQVTRARAQIDRHGLADDASMAVVFAVSAVVRGHRGRIDDALGDAEHAARLQAQLTDFAPWYEIELRIMLARAALQLSDVNRARALLGQAARLLHRAPDAPVLEAWLRDAQEQVGAFTEALSAEGPGPRLTSAELRILRYLPTHLSFREIAEQTFVSANTVKTQANAVYRKFDVSCRSEAVARAAHLGLLGA